MITRCSTEKYKNNMELSNEKVSRSCVIMSQVMGGRNEAIDSMGSFQRFFKSRLNMSDCIF